MYTNWHLGGVYWNEIVYFELGIPLLQRGCYSFLPAATKLGQGNIFTSVCQEFCPQGGRVSASVHAGISPPEQSPPDHAPPGPGTPLSRPPQSRHPPPPGPGTPPGSRLQHTVNERPVRILLECILVSERLGLLTLKFRSSFTIRSEG